MYCGNVIYEGIRSTIVTKEIYPNTEVNRLRFLICLIK